MMFSQAAGFALSNRRIAIGPRHIVSPPVDIIDGSVGAQVLGSKTLRNANDRLAQFASRAQHQVRGAAGQIRGGRGAIHQRVELAEGASWLPTSSPRA